MYDGVSINVIIVRGKNKERLFYKSTYMFVLLRA